MAPLSFAAGALACARMRGCRAGLDVPVSCSLRLRPAMRGLKCGARIESPDKISRVEKSARLFFWVDAACADGGDRFLGPYNIRQAKNGPL